MSEFSLPAARPRFGDVVVYKGPFDVEAVGDALFRWLEEVDPAAASRHLEFLEEAAERGLPLQEILLRSFDRLFQSLYDYCDAAATWGWEPSRPSPGSDQVARLGFWPVPDRYEPSPTGAAAAQAAGITGPASAVAAISPIGAGVERSDVYKDVFLGSVSRLIDHLEKVTAGNPDEQFRLDDAVDGDVHT